MLISCLQLAPDFRKLVISGILEILPKIFPLPFLGILDHFSSIKNNLHVLDILREITKSKPVIEAKCRKQQRARERERLMTSRIAKQADFLMF